LPKEAGRKKKEGLAPLLKRPVIPRKEYRELLIELGVENSQEYDYRQPEQRKCAEGQIADKR
jgi:hypothetical protein